MGSVHEAYKSLFELAGVGLAQIDPETRRYVRVNRKLCQITGYSEEELCRISPIDITYPDDWAADRPGFERLVNGELNEYTAEKRYIRKDGQPTWVLVTLNPIKDETGKLVELVSVVRDIEKRKHAEAALEERNRELAEANRAKDRFLAILSHELRTPLTPVLLATSAMEADASLPLRLRDELAMVRQNVELEARLIDDLLDHTRIVQGKLQLETRPCDVHDLLWQVHRTVQSDAEAKSISLTMQLNARETCMLGDPARMQQVLWNLLKNAIKFTSDGGWVILRTHNELAASPTAAGNSHPAGPQPAFVLDVIDSGIGIDPNHLPRIFDAFEQGDRAITKRFGGLGLGLAISKALTTAHGGTLTASSEGLDRGATFALTVPTVPTPPGVPCATSGPQLPAVASNPLRILLVEDHIPTATIMARLLRSMGHRVDVAHGVHAALDLSAGKQFDLLISDIGLPDGSGIDLMTQIRRTQPITGIAVSGYGMEDDIARSREAGFTQHWTKPINVEQLKSLANLGK